LTIPTKYRELTEEEEKAFYETPEGKVALKEQEEERAFLETPEGKAILEKQEEERVVLEAQEEEEQKAWKEQEAFYETPEGKVALKEEEKAWEEEQEGKAWKQEQEASVGGGSTGGEGKYEKKKYFDERGVWIPRIVTFLILMLLFWLIGNNESYYETALFCENRIC